MKKHGMQELALERIYRLLELAEKELDAKPARSKRYVSIALELAKKARARMPAELKAKYCKKCGAFLAPGKNARIEKKGALTIIECVECGHKRKTGEKK